MHKHKICDVFAVGLLIMQYIDPIHQILKERHLGALE